MIKLHFVIFTAYKGNQLINRKFKWEGPLWRDYLDLYHAYKLASSQGLASLEVLSELEQKSILEKNFFQKTKGGTLGFSKFFFLKIQIQLL